MKDKIKNFTIGLLVGGAIATTVVLLTSCSSFEPIKIKGEQPECNDWYTTMKYFHGLKKTDTMILTTFNKCNDARQRKRNADCKQWIYGNNPVNPNKQPEHTYYKNCTK